MHHNSSVFKMGRSIIQPSVSFSYCYNHRITSIILSRFILDLHRSADEHSTPGPDEPTLQFARRVEDDLGGSLSSIWWNDIEGDEDMQFSENPEMQSEEQTRSESTS